MAYNLESLVKILEQILHHDHSQSWILDPNKRPQIASLLQKVCFLKDLVENSSSAVTSCRKQRLESRIRDAAQGAEDILESKLTELFLSIREGESFIFSPPDLEKVIEEVDTIKKEMMTMMDGNHKADTSSAALSSSRQDPNPNNIIVGVAQDLIQLKDRLFGQPSKALQVIAIVGMGGIGKTALARNLYDDPSVISHFDACAWATISQDYSMEKLQEILLGLLDCLIGKPEDEMLEETNDELALRLHQALIGRRYLIILDDMWDVKLWDDIRRFFPDQSNGSRIIVTTRELGVADYTGTESLHHQMNLLKDDESWNLLRQKVFASEETCPPELEKVGKKIAKDCRGLPLAIHVIGGILSQAKTSQDFWDQVSDNVSSTVADKGEQFSNILSLSYNYLPDHLRPCFLYMGAFPEDYEIRTSRLIKLWAAEGFVRPIPNKSLEEAAKMHLKALVDRNLLFVRRQETKENVKSYSIHDLLRDLCVRKAHQEKFLVVHGWTPGNLPINTSYLCRVCTHGPFSSDDAYISTEQIRLARSWLDFGPVNWKILSESRLLRVLDILWISLLEFPEEILQLINLRYLAFSSAKGLPSSISRLLNLQTLIAQRSTNSRWPRDIAPGILYMTQLRHIKFKRTHVRFLDKDNLASFVLQDKLQTLSTIALSEINHWFLDKIPNLQKLGVICDEIQDTEKDLSRLHKLHTLKLSSTRFQFTFNVIFPPYLKKLTLKRCTVLDHHLNAIGKLLNLEILKLQECKFKSLRWEPNEGEFCQLQFLRMDLVDLVNWVVDDTNFPRLDHLVIRGCRHLEEIPLAIGDIPTLKVIEVDNSSPSVLASAREIQQAQLDSGNDLEVRLGTSMEI
ncbi:putative late blight resistance protein homolog R1B-16 [Sesamum indicum]|uniref:Late blight resistance protein homolog R1B-16 n=1 Tax=Sesamum indicum TaxID=4182 RepID=A0A6I9TPJ8_SESIN|nr:putative late blight resistance protein homolog R1B-16 [Sesamum indicum]